MNGGVDYQIYGALKQRLQILKQAEISVGVLVQIQFLEAHEEIEITVRWVKVRPGSRTEKLDAMDAVTAAHSFQFPTLFLYQAVHGVLPSPVVQMAPSRKCHTDISAQAGRTRASAPATYSELIFDKNWLFAVVLLSLSISNSIASTGDSGFSTLRSTQMRCKSSFGINNSSFRVPER